jgi:carbon starvation protein
MLLESFISVIALIAATHLYPADYYAINTLPEVFRTLDPALQQVRELPWLSERVGEELTGRPGGAVSLAVGMTSIFSRIPFFSHLASYWYHFAIMFEALFILTTIDAGTRVGRYLLQEMGGKIYKPLGRLTWWPGVLFCGGVISLAWGYLVYNGSISTIWPLFGTANQLLGTLALAVGTTFLLRRGKKKYIWVTAIPMFFLAATTLAAGVQSIFTHYFPEEKYLLAAVSVLIILMILAVLVDSIRQWIKILRKASSPQSMNT